MIRIARLDPRRVSCASLSSPPPAAGGAASPGSTNSSSQTPANFDFGDNNPLKVTAFGDSITQGVLELKRRDLGLAPAATTPTCSRASSRASIRAGRGQPRRRAASGRGRPAPMPRDPPRSTTRLRAHLEGTNDAQPCEPRERRATTSGAWCRSPRPATRFRSSGRFRRSFRTNDCPDAFLGAVNSQIHAFADAENVTVAEIHDGMNSRSLFGLSADRDPLHPNEQGYGVMADIWLQAIVQATPGGATAALRRRR